MKYWKAMVLLVASGSLSCRDATAPRREVPSYAHFMQVSVDPTCDYVSTVCAYTINGVTVYGGGSDNPPPLIIWDDPAPDPPSIYDWLPYPNDDYSGYYGATVGSTSQWLQVGATIVEKACDPRPEKDPNCLRPLQPRDSVFFTTVLTDLTECTLYIKCDDEMESQEMADECAEMRGWLQQAIYDSFNRPAGNTTQGFFRGANGTGPIDGDAMVIHGGITNGGSAHADEREWGIYAADSLYQRRHLIGILMHEAVHIYSTHNHGPPDHPDYALHPYFQYLIPGNRHGCVRV